VTAPAENLVGAVIGGYELRERLSSDAQGDVYRGHDPARGYATIKVLRQPLEGNAADRLFRSAAVTAAVDEPHVVTVRAVVDAPHKRTALVLEDLDGRTLSDEVSVGGLATERILRIADQIADAMIAIHATGVVHGALSPTTVLLVVQGADAHFVRVLAVGGPEAGSDLDPRDDVRALGAILYLMLAGVPPQVIGSDTVPPPPSDYVGGERSPPWLDRLVLEMLEPEADQRPASMFAVKQQLQKGRGLAHDQAVALAWADAPLAAADLPSGTSAPSAASTSQDEPPASAPAETREPSVIVEPSLARAPTPLPRAAAREPVEDGEGERLPRRGVPTWALLAAVGAVVVVGGLYWVSRGAEPSDEAPVNTAVVAPDAARVAVAASPSPPDAAVAIVPPDAVEEVATAAPPAKPARTESPPDAAAPVARAKPEPAPRAPARPHPATATPARPPRRPEPAAREPAVREPPATSPGADALRQGNAAKAAGRLDEAEQAYFRASTSGDRKAMADGTLGLADVALRRRRFSDAATKARRALSLGADRRIASEILGQAKCALGAREEAEAAFAESSSAGGPKRQCPPGGSP